MPVPRYIDGAQRLNTLRKICPEFSTVCDLLSFGTFRLEHPALSIACSIYDATYNADPAELIYELESWSEKPNASAIIPEACAHLIRFFSESNEPECTLALLRWMKEAGYITDEPEPFRL